MNAPASPLILVVSPAINSKGVRASSVRGPLFDARLDGRLVISRSTQPLLDAGRALLVEGVDQGALIVMRRPGETVDALRATVEAAAGLTVEEGSRGPTLRSWKASPHAADAAFMPQNEVAAIPPLAEQRESAPRTGDAMEAAE